MGLKRTNIWLRVVKMDKKCNAFKIIMQTLGKVSGEIGNSIEFHSLKEQMKNKYELTLLDYEDQENPNIHVACINGKLTSAIELPYELMSSNEKDKKVVEATLSHILSEANGHCDGCHSKDTEECCKINFENIMTARCKSENIVGIAEFKSEIAIPA